ncbi:MAG: hypothetical protein JJU29_21065, partial [Verrucomicrobia bacterium]|nr:hypothetical protein [Verrucomicrobiota bacterium]
MPKADLHGNDLRALEPAKQWTLVIDESGTVFDADPREQVKASKAGRFVGVLVPEGGLEPLHGEWHAVNNTSQLIDEVTQRILDGRVGVLGVESASVPYSQGDRWLDGVALLLDWVLRLMPVEGATSLEVLIEQRGDFTHKQPWGLLQRDCLYRLALAFPERAARIHLKIRAIRKNESRLNGYADALAFTWARTTATSRERLKRSGLANTCLLTANNCINAREMREAWDTFAQGVQIDPLRWWEWVRQPAAREPSTLLHGFLEALARETREDAFLWQSFMAEVKRRMARTPVDLASLEAAVDWLQSCKPDSEKLPPLARMVWLTVEHARANHEGQIAVAHSRELTRLESDLFDEAAPMVCHAQLHRAVQMTNRYAFEKAEALLLPWLDHPAAVPGLRYYAHVLSSLGQHAAFQGRFQVARARFAKALEPIARLSDRAQALLDEAQTRAYLSIVLMDDPEASDEEVWREVVQVIGPLEKAAALSRTNDPARRYSLHLLLRGLCLRKNPDVEQAVVDCVDRWATGEGHPWPLIQAYRGLLMMERDQALGIELLREGALLAEAPGQGPTVALIGACIRNLATAYGEDWPGRDKQIETLAGQLPAAKDRIALLHTPPPAGRAAAMRFLSQVLPFNFH